MATQTVKNILVKPISDFQLVDMGGDASGQSQLHATPLSKLHASTSGFHTVAVPQPKVDALGNVVDGDIETFDENGTVDNAGQFIKVAFPKSQRNRWNLVVTV